MANFGAVAYEKSGNGKTGVVAITKVAITGSCPETCALKDNGCYGQQFRSGWQNAKLERASKRRTPEQLAEAEAAAIDQLSGKRPMRLHEFGDCRTNKAASIVSRAVARYLDRHKQPTWSYTHAWRKVLRRSWGKVSVLASCETLQHCAAAMKRGYAASIVVPEHKSAMAYVVNGLRVIPCPEQTGKSKDCTTCRLCWDDRALLARRAVIAFAAHGQGKAKVKAQLIQIGRME